MAAPKLTEMQKLQVKALIAKLDGRGLTQFQIRDQLKRDLGVEISQPMVSIYRKQVWDAAKKDMIADRQTNIAVKLEQIREVRREAWDAFELSKAAGHKVVKEFATERVQVSQDDYVTSENMIKRIVTREGRLPDNAYLSTILHTLKQERELLGLDPEKPTSNTQVNVVVAGAEFWQGLAKQVAQTLPMSVEQRVAEAIEVNTELDDEHANHRRKPHTECDGENTTGD